MTLSVSSAINWDISHRHSGENKTPLGTDTATTKQFNDAGKQQSSQAENKQYDDEANQHSTVQWWSKSTVQWWSKSTIRWWSKSTDGAIVLLICFIMLYILYILYCRRVYLVDTLNILWLQLVSMATLLMFQDNWVLHWSFKLTIGWLEDYKWYFLNKMHHRKSLQLAK